MISEKEINFNEICRLCIEIIPKSDNNSNKLIHLFENTEECSLPMRIMACSALEVQESDSLPKQICLPCRKMLEKLYYFRTKCKNSDTKLRRHLRLINAGKTSNVFSMDPDEDEHEDDYVKSRELFKKWDQEESAQKEAELGEREKLIEQAKKEAINCALEKEKKRYELENTKCMDEYKKKFEEKFHQKNKEIKNKQLNEEKKLNIMRKNLKIAAETAAKDLQIVNEHLKAVKAMQGFDEEVTYEIDDDDDDNEGKDGNDDRADDQNLNIINETKASDHYIKYKDGTNLKNVKKRTLNKLPAVVTPNAKKIKIAQVFNENDNIEGNEGEENIDISDYVPDGGGAGGDTGTCTVIASELIGTDDHADDEIDDGSSNIQITNKLFSVKASRCQNTDEVTYELTETTIQNDENNTNMATNDKTDKTYEFAICGKQIKTDDYQITEYLDEDYTLTNGSDCVNIVDGSEHSIDNDDNFEETKSFIPTVPINNLPEEYQDDDDDEEEDVKCIYKLDDSTSSQNDLVFVENTEQSRSVGGGDDVDQQHGERSGKLYGCVKCSQTFPRLIELKHHMTQQHTTNAQQVRGSHGCEYCERCFPSKSSLRRHVRTHTGEKPYKCSICSRAFIQKEVLKRHYMVHTGDRPFSCDQCDRAFTQREMLRQHVNRVHAENPEIIIHACPKCSKTFQHASGLSRHILVHTGRKFNCEYCSREFNDKSALKRHVVALHSEFIIVE